MQFPFILFQISNIRYFYIYQIFLLTGFYRPLLLFLIPPSLLGSGGIRVRIFGKE